MQKHLIVLAGMFWIAAATLIVRELNTGFKRADHQVTAYNNAQGMKPVSIYQDIWINPAIKLPRSSRSVRSLDDVVNMVRVEGKVLSDQPINTHAPPSFGYAPLHRPMITGGYNGISLRLVVERHNGKMPHEVPEIIDLTLAGIDTQPAFVDPQWLVTSLTSILEDKHFQLICDVVDADKPNPLGRCWLPPDADETTDVGQSQSAFNHDIGFQLLSAGLITRQPIRDDNDARLRAAFDDDNPSQSFDNLYRAAEHQARQQQMGIWHRYRDNLSTASAN